MKHEDLIYSPIGPVGQALDPNRKIPAVHFDDRGRLTGVQRKYHIHIHGKQVATYYMGCDASFHSRRYAITYHSDVYSWDTPSQQRPHFTMLFEKFRIDYDAVKHLIPVP